MATRLIRGIVTDAHKIEELIRQLATSHTKRGNAGIAKKVAACFGLDGDEAPGVLGLKDVAQPLVVKTLAALS